MSCAPLPERHPGPSNSVKNPTSAPLGELPPAVAQSSCSPLGMLGHNQPDEFRTHGVAGQPALTDLPTTAGRHEKVQTYEVVNPDSGVHDAWQTYAQVGCAGSTADKHHHRDLPSTRVRCGPLCAATNMGAAAEERGEEAAGPNPEPGHCHPDQRFHRPYPVQGWRSCCRRRCVRSRPAHVLRGLTATPSDGT